ncbi:excinuclease ABC subunit UvrC [Spiroplasma endosymbiont of Labia minor]|uniref:excinuclease ABC subunit UvrC n=1 Tax=Spiroplasma endosymbiont of Labia minor TaxID=3066305 RepID=UPI0030CC401A
MASSKVLDEVKKLPELPGCYVYRNNLEKVIYVGKAKNLKKRVSSYFNKVHNNKTTLLVRDINSVETFITENEKEALVLEQNLIKKYKPRYNISLNDDRHYPYIIITKEKDPQYKYVRSYQNSALKTFGPLPDGSSAREILKTMERLFPLRKCAGNLGKPCLYYHIDQCSGACFKDVNWSWYEKQINNVEHFFKGHSEEVILKLKNKMTYAASNLQFEEAQRIKVLLQHIELTTAKQDVELNDDLNRDVISYEIDDSDFVICTLFYRGGKLLSKDTYIDKYSGQNISELLTSYAIQLYAKNALPNETILPIDIDIKDMKINFGKIIKKNDSELRISLMNLAHSNAIDELRKSRLQSANLNYNESDVLQDLQKLLNLPTYPYHIEMFDVANILDELVTGAMVVFKGGRPSHNSFRKYNINIDAKDDYHRMQNMVYRRYQKGLVNNEEKPDLIIADGGKIQVNAIREILKILSIDIPVIGLVKDDHHRTDHICDLNNKDVYLKKTTPLFNLLARIQERVHNFAIAAFRNRQTKSLVTSHLESVNGLGKIMINKINEKYSTLSELKNADENELKLLIKNKKSLTSLLEYIENLNRKSLQDKKNNE